MTTPTRYRLAEQGFLRVIRSDWEIKYNVSSKDIKTISVHHRQDPVLDIIKHMRDRHQPYIRFVCV